MGKIKNCRKKINVTNSNEKYRTNLIEQEITTSTQLVKIAVNIEIASNFKKCQKERYVIKVKQRFKDKKNKENNNGFIPFTSSINTNFNK